MRFKKTLKHFSNQNKQGQVTTNAYIGRNANVRLTNYLDNAPPMTQPNDESTVHYEDGNEEDEEFTTSFRTHQATTMMTRPLPTIQPQITSVKNQQTQ